MNEGKDRYFSPSRAARRGFLLSGIAVAGLAAVTAAQWFNISAERGEGDLSVSRAHALTQAGEVLLVDIRRPDEWDRTGVPQGAVPIDMRDANFTLRLAELVEGDRDAPIALICARGVRSARLASRLRAAGFTDIRDVPEGMMGSGAGPGWLAEGLPVTR